MRALRERVELFPIPKIPRPPHPSSTSRRIIRRYVEACEAWEVAERCRKTLNLLWGAENEGSTTPSGFESSPPPSRVRADHRGASPIAHVWKRLLSLCSIMSRARRTQSTGGSDVERLCQALIDSYGASPLEKYVSFQASEIAEPACGSQPLKLLDMLPARE